MATFAQLQNKLLFRLRQHGVNFGGTPNNTTTDWNPPALVTEVLNEAYGRFLADTVEARIAPLRIPVQPTANQNELPLVPPPAISGNANNPCVLRVYEFSYQLGQGATLSTEWYRPIVSTERFRRLTAGYRLRYGAYSLYPWFVCQQFNRGVLEMWPGTAESTDTINLTICPDVLATGTYSYTGTAPTCAQGGPMSGSTDVPIFPQQFHEALVEFALIELCASANRQWDIGVARQCYNDYVQAALDWGVTNGEGDPEQIIGDPFVPQDFVGGYW